MMEQEVTDVNETLRRQGVHLQPIGDVSLSQQRTSNYQPIIAKAENTSLAKSRHQPITANHNERQEIYLKPIEDIFVNIY